MEARFFLKYLTGKTHGRKKVHCVFVLKLWRSFTGTENGFITGLSVRDVVPVNEHSCIIIIIIIMFF